MRRRTLTLSAAATVAVAAIGVDVMTALPASAATGCRVGYSVSSQWPGGFGANVTITNLGDPVTTWTLVWSYSAGQQVTQAWNATVTQSGSQVTAKNVELQRLAGDQREHVVRLQRLVDRQQPRADELHPQRHRLHRWRVRLAEPDADADHAVIDAAADHLPADDTASPSDAVWVATGAWDTWTNNGYTVNNDVWGSGAGPQTIWARTGTNWGVIAEPSVTSGVKSYPHTGKTLNRTRQLAGHGDQLLQRDGARRAATTRRRTTSGPTTTRTRS